MKFLWTIPVLLALPGVTFGAARTMRLDYYHTGNSQTELFSVDRVLIEPLAWPGNPAQAIDRSNLGQYFFEVADSRTHRVLYSRGFSSIYAEWVTTAEAQSATRTFQESLRFPMPDAPVDVVISERDAANAFKEIWKTHIDPADRTIDRFKPPAPAPLLTIQNSGDPATKVDLLILGDGYTAAEAGKFEHDVHRLVDTLFATSPFKEHRAAFNVWALCPPASQSGISRPSAGIYRGSPIGAAYDAFGSERYILTFDNRAFRTAASFAPYDFVEILTNSRTYGGGGIFGQFATVAADSVWAPYVFIHEFGHHFAGLADEYFTSAVAYTTPKNRIEPWEPNVTALLDSRNIKWKDLLSPDTPMPTPWDQTAFTSYSLAIQERRTKLRAEGGSESQIDALFREEQSHETEALAAEPYHTRVGAFEGAMYEGKGYYRPQVDCIMFTRDVVPFCAVCRRAIERIIAMYS